MKPAALLTRLVGLWLLTGAVMKLFFGTPADLPQVIRDLPLRAGLLFQVAIAVELVVGAFALLRPSRGWLPAAVLMSVFLVVLGLQIARGEEACGCFGTAVTITPEVMLGIDGGLFLLLVLSRPWRLEPGRGDLPWAVFAVVALAGIALAVFVDREAVGPGDGDGGGRKWVDFTPAEWRGKRLADTSLGPWLPKELAMEEGLIVIWRPTCHVCADHLRDLAVREQGDRPVLLIELPLSEEEKGEPVAVETLPSGPFVSTMKLTEGIDWLVTAPAHVELKGGVVEVAAEGADVLKLATSRPP